MTLNEIWYLIGDIFEWTFQWLQNDFWLTSFMNTGILVLGFIGLIFWLNTQRKFNEEAKRNPDQRK